MTGEMEPTSWLLMHPFSPPLWEISCKVLTLSGIYVGRRVRPSTHILLRSRRTEMKSTSAQIVSVVVAVSAWGCGESPEPGQREVVADPDIAISSSLVPFPEAFDTVFVVQPEQPDTALIVHVTDAVLSPTGVLAISDASEYDVKLYDRDGRLLAVLGRPGGGPGEFLGRPLIAFAPNGDLITVDTQRRTMARWSAEGQLTDETIVEDLVHAWDMEVLDRDNLIVTGRVASDPGILHLISRSGNVERNSLRGLQTVRPTGSKESDLWNYIRAFDLAVEDPDGPVWVVAQPSDTLWSVGLEGHESRRRITSAALEPLPRLGRTRPQTTADLVAWLSTLRQTTKATATANGVLAISFMRGTVEDPEILLALRRGGRWQLVTDAPVIRSGGPQGFLAWLNPGEADVRLGVFRPKGD